MQEISFNDVPKAVAHLIDKVDKIEPLLNAKQPQAQEADRWLNLNEANTTIPTKKTEVFSTASDNQPSVEIHVLQGERPMASGNKTIGRFHLDGIPPAPRGVPQIEVMFDIDANGILNVSARDKGTGKQQSIRIEASSGLTDQEIQKMKAEANAEADRQAKERVDKMNHADSLIFQTEKQLKDFGDKLPVDKKGPIENALAKLKEAHKNQDIAGIDAATAELNTVFQAPDFDTWVSQTFLLLENCINRLKNFYVWKYSILNDVTVFWVSHCQSQEKPGYRRYRRCYSRVEHRIPSCFRRNVPCRCTAATGTRSAIWR